MSLASPLYLQYAAIELLGRGTSGTCYRCVDVGLRSDVVVKRLGVPAWLSDDERADRIRRLAGMLEQQVEIRHAHLASMRQVVASGSGIDVVRDYVPGTSLAARIRRAGPLTCSDAAVVASQVASAADHLAKSGMAHGALTLHNIVLTPDGDACVTDASIRAAAAQPFLAGARSVQYAGDDAERDDVRAIAGAICAMLAGVPDGFTEALRGSLYRLPTRARIAFEHALDGGRAAFDLATPLVQTLDPQHHPSLWQIAWRPAAAVGIFAVLATMPGSALTEQEQHPPAARVVSAAAPVRIAGAEILGRLSAGDVDVLRTAARRLGPALLARPVVADVFVLTDAQRHGIQVALDAHRQRVDQVVSSAAAGTPIDTGRAMSDARTATNSCVLHALDGDQRAAWRAIAEDNAASSSGL